MKRFIGLLSLFLCLASAPLSAQLQWGPQIGYTLLEIKGPSSHQFYELGARFQSHRHSISAAYLRVVSGRFNFVRRSPDGAKISYQTRLWTLPGQIDLRSQVDLSYFSFAFLFSPLSSSLKRRQPPVDQTYVWLPNLGLSIQRKWGRKWMLSASFSGGPVSLHYYSEFAKRWYRDFGGLLWQYGVTVQYLINPSC